MHDMNGNLDPKDVIGWVDQFKEIWGYCISAIIGFLGMFIFDFHKRMNDIEVRQGRLSAMYEGMKERMDRIESSMNDFRSDMAEKIGRSSEASHRDYQDLTLRVDRVLELLPKRRND